MAYDPQLAARVRQALAAHPDVSERKMMGGVCFMLNGNMCCGVRERRLMVRVGPEAYAACLAEPYVRPLQIGDCAPKGFVTVDEAGLADGGFDRWLARATSFVSTLAPKPP